MAAISLQARAIPNGSHLQLPTTSKHASRYPAGNLCSEILRKSNGNVLPIQWFRFRATVLYKKPGYRCRHVPTSVTASAHGSTPIQDASSERKTGARSPRKLGIVITGGTKGVGYAMADEFLAAGDDVVICGREAARVRRAVDALNARGHRGTAHGISCDVSNPNDVASLASFAAKSLPQGVHRWINNAGSVTRKKMLADLEPGDIAAAVGSNVLGSLYGSREAIRLMRVQGAQAKGAGSSSASPGCHVFNLGFSSWGANFSKSACTHKATKRALSQLCESLAGELKEAGLAHEIGVHNLSPGMVLTDLLLKDSTPVARRFFNTLAEEPETVAAALVPRIRDLPKGSNGTSIEYLTPLGAVSRVLGGMPQIIRGGRFFDQDGNRNTAAGMLYKTSGARAQYKGEEE